MFFVKGKNLKTGLLLLLGLVTLPAFANEYNAKQSNVVFQVGGSNTTAGNAQNINIDGLIGDYFSVTKRNDQNFLVGLGYFRDAYITNRFTLMYGVNAFYLAPTAVEGNVTQEQLFTNLSYSYSITNYPIYLSAKALINTNSDRYKVTVDAGIGPNFIQTGEFTEQSLDGGVTLPDNIFSGRTKVVFSASAGLGLKFNNVLDHMPLEINYRFFYLGQGNLNVTNSQVLNSLSTGTVYANALFFTLSF